MIVSEALEGWRKVLVEQHGDREADSILKILRKDHPSITSLKMSDDINQNEFEEILKAILSGKPVQQICGVAYFYDRLFKVNEHTLIPRPETEELVYQIIKDNKSNENRILDVGTGTGCIPIILKSHIPHSDIVSIDISKEALAVANQNALEHNVSVDFRELDFLNNVVWPSLGNFDLIVSNPPYIDITEKDKMPAHVIDFEPKVALFTSKGNPLKFYEKIHAFSKDHLNPLGRLYLELNEFRMEETKSIFQEDYEVSVIQDLQGKSRILKCIKN